MNYISQDALKKVRGYADTCVVLHINCPFLSLKGKDLAMNIMQYLLAATHTD